jgi:hypothetical protein
VGVIGMGFIEGLLITTGANILSGIFGGGRSRPREDPNVAYLRQLSAKMMGRGLEETEQLIPLLKGEAETEKKRYLENYGAYKEAVSRLTETLSSPFLPLRETLTRVSETEKANTERLLGAGLSPALASAIAKANSEEAYFNTVEQIRQAKLNQQIQATNAIGSLLQYSSAPMTALSALGGLASSLTSGGMGGYSQALEISQQQRALDEQLRMQRQSMIAQIASAIGSMYANSRNPTGGGWL